MILKRKNNNGEKYYVNAFTGKIVKFKIGDPLTKEPNQFIASVMNQKVSNFNFDNKAKKTN